jgi:hypothetical protein
MRESFPSYCLSEKRLVTREEFLYYSQFEAVLTFFILIRSSSSIWPLLNTLTATKTPLCTPLYTSADPPDATGVPVSTTSPLEMLCESGSKQWVPHILRKTVKHFCRRGAGRSDSSKIWRLGELILRRDRDRQINTSSKMFAVNKASAPFDRRIDLIPSRVKVFVLMDSRVISRNKTYDCEPRRKEVALRHTIHLFDVNIGQKSRCGEVTFKVKAASRQRGGNHAAGLLRRQSD